MNVGQQHSPGVPGESATGNLRHPASMDGFVPFRLNVLYRLLTRRAARRLAERHDLSLAEWWILAAMTHQTASTVGRLAELTYLDKAQVSRAMDMLRGKGLAARRPDPSDGRSTLYTLTAAGRERFDRVLPDRLDLHRSLVETLGEQRAGEFMAAINQLIEYFENTDDP